jgi:hypothetical protein
LHFFCNPQTRDFIQRGRNAFLLTILPIPKDRKKLAVKLTDMSASGETGSRPGGDQGCQMMDTFRYISLSGVATQRKRVHKERRCVDMVLSGSFLAAQFRRKLSAFQSTLDDALRLRRRTKPANHIEMRNVTSVVKGSTTDKR